MGMGPIDVMFEDGSAERAEVTPGGQSAWAAFARKRHKRPRSREFDYRPIPFQGSLYKPR
jgi:hypothetical protein